MRWLTPCAARWQLRISALRLLSAMSVLNTNVATGCVLGTRPKTTPIGLAISAILRSESTRSNPAPGFPDSEA